MAPVCGPFGPLGRLNQHIHPESMHTAYEGHAPLARFCGRVALAQYEKGLHFIQEQPHPSLLYQETPWPHVLSLPNVVQTIYHRCMMGLRVQHGECKGYDLKKPSSTTASCPELTYYFEGKICSQQRDHIPVTGALGKKRYLLKC